MTGSAAFFGAGTALFWGVSDVFARLSGRSAGVLVTTLAMMTIGSVVLIIYVFANGDSINWDPSGYWLIAVSGVCTAVGTILIYAALTRGPVSLASPAAASYPAISVPITVALGERPELLHWLAMIGAMVGVWLVARSVGRRADGGLPDYERRNIRITLLISIAAAAVFALALITAGEATKHYGWLQTLLGSRLLGAVVFLAVLAVRREAWRPVPIRAWPFLLVLGLLDTGGHAALYAGLALPNGQFAVVASAGYTVVTTIIARLFLHEPVSLAQWLGIGLVVAGVAALATLG